MELVFLHIFKIHSPSCAPNSLYPSHSSYSLRDLTWSAVSYAFFSCFHFPSPCPSVFKEVVPILKSNNSLSNCNLPLSPYFLIFIFFTKIPFEIIIHMFYILTPTHFCPPCYGSTPQNCSPKRIGDVLVTKNNLTWSFISILYC